MKSETVKILQDEANRYETETFLFDDPSCFMHKVKGKENQEITAFIAANLSYGSREQFLPKIEHLIQCAKNDVYQWIKSKQYTKDIPCNDDCFYRLYTNRTMLQFFNNLSELLNEYGSLGDFAKKNSTDKTAISVIENITKYFNKNNEASHIVPKDTKSSCKRLCMFMRWMVRYDSPVDLGLWSSFIERKSLIMPLDTHVMQEAQRLGLTKTKSTTMAAAIKLTNELAKAFPDDPVKGDFALFGYGVNH